MGTGSFRLNISTDDISTVKDFVVTVLLNCKDSVITVAKIGKEATHSMS